MICGKYKVTSYTYACQGLIFPYAKKICIWVIYAHFTILIEVDVHHWLVGKPSHNVLEIHVSEYGTKTPDIPQSTWTYGISGSHKIIISSVLLRLPPQMLFLSWLQPLG